MPAAKGRRMIGTWRHLGRRVWHRFQSIAYPGERGGPFRMGRDERDRVPPGTFRSADSGTVEERTPARRPSRPPRPRPEPERGRRLARESLRPSDSSSCLVTGVFLHTVETAAILETLETRVRRRRRLIGKKTMYVPWQSPGPCPL